MLKTKSSFKTITRTFTIREDVYDKFKIIAPERKMSAMVNELIEGYVSRYAFRELGKYKFSAKESARFVKIIQDADRAALKDEAKMLAEFQKI